MVVDRDARERGRDRGPAVAVSPQEGGWELAATTDQLGELLAATQWKSGGLLSYVQERGYMDGKAGGGGPKARRAGGAGGSVAEAGPSNPWLVGLREGSLAADDLPARRSVERAAAASGGSSLVERSAGGVSGSGSAAHVATATIALDGVAAAVPLGPRREPSIAHYANPAAMTTAAASAFASGPLSGLTGAGSHAVVDSYDLTFSVATHGP